MDLIKQINSDHTDEEMREPHKATPHLKASEKRRRQDCEQGRFAAFSKLRRVIEAQRINGPTSPLVIISYGFHGDYVLFLLLLLRKVLNFRFYNPTVSKPSYFVVIVGFLFAFLGYKLGSSIMVYAAQQTVHKVLRDNLCSSNKNTVYVSTLSQPHTILNSPAINGETITK